MRLDDALNECLDLLAAGASLEDCLARYPGQAAELEPLLHTTLALRRATAIPLRPGFRAEGRARLLGALAASRALRPSRGLGWGWRWAVTGLLIAFLLGGQVVRASAHSLPGEPLYPVKQAVEQVQLTLSQSPGAKAKLSSQQANRRIQELVEVAQKGKLAKEQERFQERTEHLLEQQAKRLQQVVAVAREGIREEDKEAVLIRVEAAFQSYQARLWQLLEQVPEPARPALRQAIDKSGVNYRRALKALAPPQPRLAKVKGLIRAIQAQDGVVIILQDKGDPVALTVAEDSQVSRDGAPVGIDGLVPGDLVTTTYNRASLKALSIQARSPSQTQGEVVEFTGTMEEQDNGRWLVSGRQVIIGPDTELDVQGPARGGQAQIVAEAQTDGTLKARKVEVRPPPGDEVRPARSRLVRFTGTIQRITPKRWLVSDREVIITRDTKLDVVGPLRPGARTRVVAERRPDGSLVAQKIAVVGQKATPAREGTQPQKNHPYAKDSNRPSPSDKNQPPAKDNSRPSPRD